jgi:hypothetical protein
MFYIDVMKYGHIYFIEPYIILNETRDVTNIDL